MENLVTIHLHHHGEFTPQPDVRYKGGKVEVIRDFDLDMLSFRDFDDFAVKYSYDPSDLVYFKNDGKTWEGGVRLIYDNTVREMILIHQNLNKIELFVDHFSLDEVIDMPGSEKNDYESAYNSEGDPNYSTDTESDSEEDNTSLHDQNGMSDDELATYRENVKNFKQTLSIGLNTGAENFNMNNIILSDESDYGFDGLRTDSSSSEDENARIGYVGPPNPKKKRTKRGLVMKSDQPGIIRWQVGMKFTSMGEFREAVRQYGLRDRRAIQFVTNDAKRSQVCCEVGCKFYIWCSKDKDSDYCTIKTLFDEHNCTKPYTNKLATVKYLCAIYGERIRKNPQWKVREIAETIKQELEINVTRIKILRLRKAALDGVHDALKEHYSRLRDFANEILLSNNKNTIQIRTTRLNETDLNKFKRIYVCYYALKAGWKAGCRPIIGLDGCFLKTICGGQLLSAIGRDGNNHMYPIAYAVVESENTESWKWFIDLLRDDLELGHGTGYTIISDQQKGLENAIKELLPNVEHRFCTRHLYNNWRKRFASNRLKDLFWMAACATHKTAHARAMKQMERYSKIAYEKLQKLDAKVWSKAYFSTHSKADNCENNMSECFNAWIVTERFMPLITMMQEIHFKLMTRFRQKRDYMLRANVQLCPNIKKQLDYLVTESRKWTAGWDGEKKFLVKQGTKAVTVNLETKSCDCRVFDLTGIPCEHAIAAIHDRRHHPIDYVSDYYKRDKYLAAYAHSLEAIKGEEYWEIHSNDQLLPPDVPKKLRGRPKRLRRREKWEGGNRSRAIPNIADGPVLRRFSNKRIMHCSLCGDSSHRKTNCPTKGDATTEAQSQVTERNASSQPVKKTPKEARRQKLTVRRRVLEDQNDGVEEGTENTLVEKAATTTTTENNSEKVLRRPVISTSVFIPTPGHTSFMPTGLTPPATELPVINGTSTSRPVKEAAKRKGTRLNNTKLSKFKNGRDNLVNLAKD